MLPTIIIANRSDDSFPLHTERDWSGPVPEGWVQVGFVDAKGKRYIDYDLEREQ